MSAIFVFASTIGRAAFTGNHQWIIHDPANEHNLRSEVQFLFSPLWTDINVAQFQISVVHFAATLFKA
jgi:hypothetical protein